MGVIDGRTWIEHLSERECWDLLAAEKVGRIGVLVDSAPEVYPVNYAVDGRSIVFRTDPGSKLRGIDRSPSVCFEIDELDDALHSGWSVLLKGRAVELTAPDDLHRVGELRLEFWTLGDKTHWVRIEPREVTGRRVRTERPAS